MSRNDNLLDADITAKCNDSKNGWAYKKCITNIASDPLLYIKEDFLADWSKFSKIGVTYLGAHLKVVEVIALIVGVSPRTTLKKLVSILRDRNHLIKGSQLKDGFDFRYSLDINNLYFDFCSRSSKKVIPYYVYESERTSIVSAGAFDGNLNSLCMRDVEVCIKNFDLSRSHLGNIVKIYPPHPVMIQRRKDYLEGN